MALLLLGGAQRAGHSAGRGVAHVSQVAMQDWQRGGAGTGRGVAPHHGVQLAEVGGGQGALQALQELKAELLQGAKECGAVGMAGRTLQVLAALPAVP